MVEKVEEIPDHNYQVQDADDNVLNQVVKWTGRQIGNVVPGIETKDKLVKKKEDLSKEIERLKVETDNIRNKLKKIQMIDPKTKKTTFWKRLFKADEREFKKIIMEFNKKYKIENEKIDELDKKIEKTRIKAEKLNTKKLFKPEGMMLLLLDTRTREAIWYINVKPDVNLINIEKDDKHVVISKDKLFSMKVGEERFFLYVADTDNMVAYPIEPFFDTNIVYGTFVSFISNLKALRDLKTGNQMGAWGKIILYAIIGIAIIIVLKSVFFPTKEVVQAAGAVIDANTPGTIAGQSAGVIPQ